MKKLILCICIAALVLVGCTSKPSQSEIKKFLTQQSLGSLPSDATQGEKDRLKAYAECLVENSYDDVSAKSWNRILDAKNADDLGEKEFSESEKNALNAASDKCDSKLG